MENKYVFEFKNTRFIFDKDESDKDKYVIFCCAKNEDEYLTEFINHHLSIGFDKIIIADNNDDSTVLPILLKEYVNNGKVQIMSIPNLKEFQCSLYDKYLKSDNFKWCAFIDCDEFIELNGCFDDIKDFLSNVTDDCVTMNWMMYGFNGHLTKTKGTLKERFSIPIIPTNYMENLYFKSIVRSGITDVYYCQPHNPFIFENKHDMNYNIGGVKKGINLYQTTEIPYYKYIYIKHYYTKSVEEFSDKINRKWPDASNTSKRNSIMLTALLNKVDNYNFDALLNGGYHLFSCNDSLLETKKYINNTYDVIVLESGRNYSLIAWASYFFANSIGKTILLSESVDNSIYNVLLEIALQTKNRIITYKKWDTDFFYKMYCKYTNKPDSSYYMLKLN